MSTNDLVICPGCSGLIPEDQQGDPLCIEHRGKQWHRQCRLIASREYNIINLLFQEQDDYKEDPDTALADLIGNLGHFADIQGIDFEEAIRRGVGYWQEERPKEVRPADSKEA